MVSIGTGLSVFDVPGERRIRIYCEVPRGSVAAQIQANTGQCFSML